jgi:outer membrane receptor protein involved in Fe transport
MSRLFLVGLSLLVGLTAGAEGASQTVAANTQGGNTKPGEASALLRPARLSVSAMPLSLAMHELAERSDVSIAFSPSRLASAGKVDCHCADLTVGEALQRILSGTEFEFLELGNQIVIAERTARRTLETVKRPAVQLAEWSRSLPLSLSGSLALNGSSEPRAQRLQETGVITGRVTDAGTGRPLSGVQVAVDGTQLGSLTNDEGRYMIAGVPAGARSVRAILLGFREERRSVNLQAGASVVLDFGLQVSVISMDELVVTGSMTPTALKAVSHPINIVTAAEIEALNVRRFDEVIRLTAPAVLAYSPTSSGPTGESGFRFRGSTVSACWDCSDAKIFVDGIEISSQYIFNITADQIERVEVVRGPQASTLYGSDALGGVINIFTKRGRGAQRPQLSVTTEVGRMDRLFGSGGVPKQYYAVSVIGGTGEATYRLGASYSKIGAFVPGYSDQSPALDAGVRVEQGRFLGDLVARVGQSKTDRGYDPELAAMAAGTPNAASFAPTKTRVLYRMQTLTGKLGFQATPRWRHELTAGIDAIAFESYKREPSFNTPADTFVNYNNSAQRKGSLNYRTALELPMGEALKATLTAGGDHQRWVHDYWYVLQAVSTEPLVPLSGPSAYAIQQRTVGNTGVYGQVQLDVRNSVFLNGALRAEKRTMNGLEGTGSEWPLVGKLGATYVRDIQENTFKLRASYGSTVRQNHILNSLAAFSVLDNGWTRTTLANPDLRPERQDGYDLGLDAILAGRVTVSISYYNQEMKDYVQANVLEDYPNAVWQYENIAMVRNKGLEIEGALDLGRVNIRGNYGTISSKPEDLGPITPTPGREVGKQLWFIPKSSAALAVTAKAFDKTRVSANVSHQGSMFGLEYKNRNKCRATNSPEYCPSGTYTGSADWWMDLPSATTLNIAMEQELPRSLTVYFKVDDLTNARKDFPHFSSYTYGRTVSIGARAGISPR